MISRLFEALLLGYFVYFFLMLASMSHGPAEPDPSLDGHWYGPNHYRYWLPHNYPPSPNLGERLRLWLGR